MSDSASLSVISLVQQQLAMGVKGIVVGEEHSSLSVPRHLAEQMEAFKKAGVTTLYVEHVAAENQGLLDSALAGDAAAQKKLYANMISDWYTNDAGIARYDLLFAAHKAGLRVFGINTASISEYQQQGGENHITRIIMGDNYMTREITRHHDGHGFIVLAGRDHVGNENKSSILYSRLGSIDKRLTAAGIPSIALMQEDRVGVPELGVRDYENGSRYFAWQISDQPVALISPQNQFALLQNYAGFVRDNYEHLLHEAGVKLPPQEMKATQQKLDRLNVDFNSCADVGQLADKYAPTLLALKHRVPDVHDPATDYLRAAIANLHRQLTKKDMTEDRAVFCSGPEGAKPWLRPAMPKGSSGPE